MWAKHCRIFNHQLVGAKTKALEIEAEYQHLRVVADLAADDFAQLRTTMSGKLGPVRMLIETARVKSVFKFGAESRRRVMRGLRTYRPPTPWPTG